MQAVERFSSRVANYVRYRPSYPPAVLQCLKTECGLAESWTVADVGSGTGIWTRMLLENGNEVFAVEPNGPMREAGERFLMKHPRFHSIAGTAEATALEAASVNLVTAAQAFHWFDSARCRREFSRILRAGGWIALIWNERLTEAAPLLSDYEEFLKEFATDYETVDHRRIDGGALRRFFGGAFESRVFPNAQRLDFDGLKGRLLSSSYAPESSHPRHEEMLAALRKIFERHQAGGEVAFEYETKLYFGRPG